eukprot:GHVQ01039454.1.p1 GENE.GHVQ01039454.1~~GHVQ01039454.1.p1  ORF type:complete len:260 (-),score=38.01 GHVQ01039454.1:391-1170(-)
MLDVNGDDTPTTLVEELSTLTLTDINTSSLHEHLDKKNSPMGAAPRNPGEDAFRELLLVAALPDRFGSPPSETVTAKQLEDRDKSMQRVLVENCNAKNEKEIDDWIDDFASIIKQFTLSLDMLKVLWVAKINRNYARHVLAAEGRTYEELVDSVCRTFFPSSTQVISGYAVVHVLGVGGWDVGETVGRERSGDGGGGGRGNVRFLRGLSLCYPHTHTHHHTSPSEVGHHRFPPLRSLGTTPPSDVGCLSPLSSPREPCV